MRSHTLFKVYQDIFDLSQDEDEDNDGIDILTELGVKAHYSPVVTALLSFLDPRDLTQACRVSRNWNSVVQSDIHANKRRKEYLKEMKEFKGSIGEENWPMREDTGVVKPIVRKALAPRTCNVSIFKDPCKANNSVSCNANQENLPRLMTRKVNQGSKHPKKEKSFKDPCKVRENVRLF